MMGIQNMNSQAPDGGILPNANEFGESWAVPSIETPPPTTASTEAPPAAAGEAPPPRGQMQEISFK